MYFRMGISMDGDKSGMKKFFSKKLTIVIIIVLIVGLIFGAWFFFIGDSDNSLEESDNFLPSNCYSVNDKQICL